MNDLIIVNLKYWSLKCNFDFCIRVYLIKWGIN
jgi:hypothetical protein